MAEWKERGYVPDSDDEEEEELEVWPQHEQFTSTELGASGGGDKDRSENHAIPLSSRAESQEVPLAEEAPPIVLAHEQDRDPLHAKYELRGVLQPAENEWNGRTVKKEEGVQSGTLSTKILGSIHHTEVGEDGSSVAEQLQDELNSGLDIIKEILRGSSAAVEDQFDERNGFSSPLSSIRSFSAERISEQHIPDAASDRLPSDILFPEQRHAGTVENGRHHDASLGFGAQATRRSLRHRNPIQLHPYALEGARYQQELLARGMKPVYLAGPSRRKTPDALETQDCDSQESNANDDSQDITSSQQESSGPLQPIHNGAVKRHSRRQSTNGVVSDEEMPDLDAILEGKYAGPQAGKRSKGICGVPKIVRNLDIDSDNGFHVYDLPSDSAGFTLGGDQNDAIFHVPPSSPHSRSAQSSQSTEILPKPLTRNLSRRRRTPQALPTPNTSSAAQQPTVLPLQVDNDSDSPENAILKSSDTSSRNSPNQADNQILQFQRKTKGVLPASFFRLRGQQENASRDQVRRWSLSPDRDVDAQGITHSLSRTRHPPNSPSWSSNNAIVISNDSSFDQDSSTETHEDYSALNWPTGHDGMKGLVNGGIDEEDGIDRMIQPQSRKRRIPGPAKKRQRRIVDYGSDLSNRARGELSRRSKSPKRRKALVHGGPGGQRRKRNGSTAKAPFLGPLDAPGYTNLPRMKQPQFLRVAARRARSCRMNGRQSPSRKCIRLATMADNHDANNELNNWRNGLIEPSSTAGASTQYPRQRRRFQPESSSREGLPGAPVSSSGQNHTSLGDSRNQLQVQRPSPFHRRAEDVIQQIVLPQTSHSILSLKHSSTPFLRPANDGGVSPSPPPAPVHARYRNRSGRGLLLASRAGFAKPREAQFESVRQPKTRHSILATFGVRLGSFRSGVNPNVTTPAAPAQTQQALIRPIEGSEGDIVVNDAPWQASSRALRKQPPRQADIFPLDPVWRPEHLGQAFHGDDDNFDALSGVVLAGLGSPEFPITRNLGVVPFSEDSHLHPTNFTGEGQLSQVIRNLISQPRKLIQYTSHVFEVTRPSAATSPYAWGVWNVEVSQQFSAWFAELRDCLEFQNCQGNELLHDASQNILAAFISLISYLSCHISFQDQKSLIAFAEHAFQVSHELILWVEERMESSPSTVSLDLLRFSVSLLVFIFEVACIVASASADHRLHFQVCKAFKVLALVILKVVFRVGRLAKVEGLSTVASSLSDVRYESSEMDAMVVINLLCKQTILQTDVWDLITEALMSSIGFRPENVVTFQDYDRWWKGIFLALPLLEFATPGVLQRRSGSPGWDLVQRLLIRFLNLYVPRLHSTGYSTKHYGRILVHRCFDLVQVWGWQGGHSAIGTLFDAYSGNNMGELFGETPERSFSIPLGRSPSTRIRIENNDSGFHAFLGILAQTVLDSRKPDADPKLARRVLRSLNARLVPTKSGDFARNRNPSSHDMFALRNRFDLVSVMYCTMPTEMKPSLRLFQSFVDFRNPVREACKLALGCWSQLIQYEAFKEGIADLREQEPSSDLPPTTLLFLKEWHNSMVIDLLAVYTSAVGLVKHYPACNAEAHGVPSDWQSPIAEVLKETLRACEQSFVFCQNAKQASALICHSMIGNVFRLFNAGYPGSNAIVIAALRIVRAYTRSCVSSTTPPLQADEDSQEFGSWDHFEGMVIDGQDQSTSEQNEFAYLLHQVHPMLRHFLSNVFGSDTVPDHAILKSTTDCWYDVADALVRVRARSWGDFIINYSTDSWESLRHTQQSQQYKVYFLAKIVDSDYGFYELNRVHIIGLWISSLCQPSHLLFWEHLLTSIILFHDSENQLLFNPPFAVRSDVGDKLEISMTELRERRGPMIYVVLRNMHRLLTMPAMSSQALHPYNKSEFVEIIKNIESTMKSCYQDLDADSPSQKEYRLFINFVIQQMQLYVVDFCRIDPFFTNPVISSAEAYAVTAALKRQSLTIETAGVTKAMVLFLYNAGERAAVNDNQDNLILQLCNAWLDLSQDAVERVEDHGSNQTLLILYLQNVFPAYMGHAFSAPGHILAGPLLQVMIHVYVNLRCRSDFWDANSSRRLTAATDLLLHSALDALIRCPSADILSSADRLNNFNELVNFAHAAMLRIYEVAQAFPNDVDSRNLIEILLALKEHILAVEGPTDMDSDLLELAAEPNVIASLDFEHSATRAYAERELQTALDNTWRQDRSGNWEIVGRGPAKAVKASRRIASGTAAVSEMESCRQRTRFVVREFMEAFVRLDWWE